MNENPPHTSVRVRSSASGLGNEPICTYDATHGHTGGDAQGGPDAAPCAVLDADGVGHVLGVGRSKVYDLDQREALPSPITLSARRRRWVAAEIRAWLLHGAPKRTVWQRLWPRVRREMLR
ncbi:MAG: AlpA family phage regulatory protein [bacterium]|nr:AlpA family phage regulatory protein [bacterium]